MEESYRSIKAWAEDDRPREKLQLKGRTALSNAELIAILLGNGTRGSSALDLGKNILHLAGDDLHTLGRCSIEDICKIKGIGQAKAITLIAALELGRRRKIDDKILPAKITSSSNAFEHLQPIMMDLDHEEFWIIFLNNANRIIDKTCISKGGFTGTIVDIRLVFREAVSRKATGILISHNHPSGTLKPSEQDINLTKKIREGGALLDIQLIDHLILAQDKYYSFRDNGIL
jgi:DNA repair protein RadC